MIFYDISTTSRSRYGKPTCASDEMNNQMVRGDWGWNGFFVSDCTALELMQVRKTKLSRCLSSSQFSISCENATRRLLPRQARDRHKERGHQKRARFHNDITGRQVGQLPAAVFAWELHTRTLQRRPQLHRLVRRQALPGEFQGRRWGDGGGCAE
jgi:hypothetical protein